MRTAILVPLVRVTAITLVTGGLFFAGTANAQASVDREIAASASIKPINAGIEALAPAIADARSDVELAQAALTSSKSKVTSETHRRHLGELVTSTQTAIHSAEAAIQDSTPLLRGSHSPEAIERSTKALTGAGADLVAIHGSTTDTIKLVSIDVTAWHVEQRRAAEEAQRADAAKASAAAALKAERTRPAVSSTAPASSGATPVQAAAPVVDKRSICQGVMARFGFSNVVYDSGASQGHYGATDLDNQVIYIQLSIIPVERVSSVCIHEYMHIIQARQYGGYAATVAHFGSVLGMERNADQMARANGATWTNYL
ncbi:hypothetical protein GCM10025867_47510 (plasmid) [Frondihabitans sucicola]|uniref:Uncharacterized protein n=1 Tax=Frondihabitans sucicola TaxID=1268041 RepID=A0ABN6Y5A4_9MICO|nr:hypothetical protein [Frondihabitans sucicola]BDZ52510.1 hypothetical protein GCM10025867_47510 [Frondihabitans sucicola]